MVCNGRNLMRMNVTLQVARIHDPWESIRAQHTPVLAHVLICEYSVIGIVYNAHVLSIGGVILFLDMPFLSYCRLQ